MNEIKTDTETIDYKPMVSFWCLYCWLLTCFVLCSNVSIVNFEMVNAGWDS